MENVMLIGGALTVAFLIIGLVTLAMRPANGGIIGVDLPPPVFLLPGEAIVEQPVISQPVTAILQAMKDRPDSFYFYSPNKYTPHGSELLVVDSATRVSFSLYTSYSGMCMRRSHSSCAGWISNEEASALAFKCRAMMKADNECRDNLERIAICALYNVTPPQTPDNQPTS